MSLREHEAVSVLILRIICVNIHLLRVKICQYIAYLEQTAEMFRLCIIDTLDKAYFYCTGNFLKLFFNICVHNDLQVNYIINNELCYFFQS